jgi:hypothetical protein
MRVSLFLLRLFLVLFTIVAVPIAVIWCSLHFFLKDMWVDYWQNCVKAVVSGYFLGMGGMSAAEVTERMELEEYAELQVRMAELEDKYFIEPKI